GRRATAVAAQDPPHHRFTQLTSQTEDFAMYSPISPPGILARESVISSRVCLVDEGGLAGSGTATSELPGDGDRRETWPLCPACASAAVAAAAVPTQTEPLDLATMGVAGQLGDARREVGPGRPASVAAGGFPWAASRTRRAPQSAPGSPQAPGGRVVWLMLCSAMVSGCGFPGSSSASR